MIERIHAYISAEKLESLLFVAVGVTAILIAAWLWMQGHRLKAMHAHVRRRRGVPARWHVCPHAAGARGAAYGGL